MKTHSTALIAVLVSAVVLLAGCSKPAQKENPPQTSPQAAVNPQPAITTPAEKAPEQAAPVAPAPAPPKAQPKPAVPAKTKQASGAVQKTPKPAEQTAPTPVVKAPAVAETVPAVTPPKAQRFTVPSGTLIPVRMIDSVDSRTDQVGQIFRASVDSDITLQNQIIVPKGANASLKLTRVSSAGAIRGKSELQLVLDRIVIGTTSYAVTSDVVERSAKAEGTRTARDVGIGAAIGAAIGAVTGGKKGAAIGAGVGAGSGAAVAAITKGEQVLVPSETRLEFRLKEPVEMMVMPRAPTD